MAKKHKQEIVKAKAKPKSKDNSTSSGINLVSIIEMVKSLKIPDIPTSQDKQNYQSLPNSSLSSTQPKSPSVINNYINNGNINIINPIDRNTLNDKLNDLGEVIKKQAPEQQVYCSNCGADLSDLSYSSQFCPYCGYQFRRKKYE